MRVQSYPGAAYGRQSSFPPIWQFTPQPYTVCLWFFFSQSRPPAHRSATSDPRFGFSTVDPPTHAENSGKKKVESKKRSFGVQTKPVEIRRVSKPDTENRDSASGLCHVCLFGRRADEKKRRTGGL